MSAVPSSSTPTLVSPGPESSGRAPSSAEQVLRGPHRLLARLGDGGTSTVFEGEDLVSGAKVAVKVLATPMTVDQEITERFCAEAEMLRRIEHPHVVRAVDVGETESGTPYLVLEFLEGETLRQRLRRGPIPLDVCVRIACQLASALAAAHAAEIVHRDLKPANVFLTGSPASPFVKLLDFGISKDLRADADDEGAGIIGTPEYMAPEQANGANALIDERTDQYALALLVYEMLTRRQPFSGSGISDTLRRVRSVCPFSSGTSGLSPAIESTLARGMAKSKEARFGDVLEFARHLSAACAGVHAVSSDALPSPSHGARRDSAGRTTRRPDSVASGIVTKQGALTVAAESSAVDRARTAVATARSEEAELPTLRCAV